MDASDRRRRVTEEAAEWWVLLQGDVSRPQREQYVNWLRESSVHVAEMLRIGQIHGALEQFQRWPGIPTDGSRDHDGSIVTLHTDERRTTARRSTSERTPRRLGMVWIIAAAMLLITGIATVLVLSERAGVIQTERGERREVALVDGSVLQVDPETRLRVDYEQRTRRVFLEHGRALFHVAKNAQRPFLVESNDTTVRAVGTAFAVEQQNESTVVTVAEGKVAVFAGHPPMAAAPISSPPSESAEFHDKVAPGDRLPSTVSASSGTFPRAPSGAAAPTIYLTANQQVTMSRSGNAESLHAVDSGRTLAWADGRLIFENTSVGDAIRQFNRYNRVQIIVNDIDLARRPISGVFSAADPESFAAFIQSVARVRITSGEGADITIDVAK